MKNNSIAITVFMFFLIFLSGLIALSPALGNEHDDKVNQLHSELKKLSFASDYYLSNSLEIYKKLLSLDPDNSLYKFYINKFENEIEDKKSNKAERDILKELETVPEEDFQKNYFLYSRLVNLNKNNSEYISKHEFYKGKYNTYIDGKTNKLNEIKKGLRIPKGNEFVQMAVEYLGSGNFYVWIVNVSNQPFHVNPNHFTLVGRNQRSYHYSGSDGIMVDLQPGTITEGHIAFDSYGEPKEIIYSNPYAGRISRVFN